MSKFTIITRWIEMTPKTGEPTMKWYSVTVSNDDKILYL